MLPIKIKWKVIKWKQLSRTLWFPTANIKITNKKIKKIKPGTYSLNIIFNKKIYSWIWVLLQNTNIFEANIFNFNKNIYSKAIKILVLKKIRNNINFGNLELEEIKLKLKEDKKTRLKLKLKVLTFWTFDLIHKWHIYYLKKAREYWTKLITVISRDKNVLKIKNHKTLYSEDKRIKDIKKLNISDKIILWKKDNSKKLDIIKEINPNIIVMWYDQKWFKSIKNYVNKNNLKIKIIRLKWYKPNIYKSSILKKH